MIYGGNEILSNPCCPSAIFDSHYENQWKISTNNPKNREFLEILFGWKGERVPLTVARLQQKLVEISLGENGSEEQTLLTEDEGMRFWVFWPWKSSWPSSLEDHPIDSKWLKTHG